MENNNGNQENSSESNEGVEVSESNEDAEVSENSESAEDAEVSESNEGVEVSESNEDVEVNEGEAHDSGSSYHDSDSSYNYQDITERDVSNEKLVVQQSHGFLTFYGINAPDDTFKRVPKCLYGSTFTGKLMIQRDNTGRDLLRFNGTIKTASGVENFIPDPEVGEPTSKLTLNVKRLINDELDRQEWRKDNFIFRLEYYDISPNVNPDKGYIYPSRSHMIKLSKELNVPELNNEGFVVPVDVEMSRFLLDPAYCESQIEKLKLKITLKALRPEYLQKKRCRDDDNDNDKGHGGGLGGVVFTSLESGKVGLAK